MHFNPIYITDAEDPRVHEYVNVRERDLSGRNGCFVAEGENVLKLLINTPLFNAHSVLISENKLHKIQQIFNSAPSFPIYVASQNVMDCITGFHIHRGILAIGHDRMKRSVPDLLDALPVNARVVVLIGISNHDNMGGIFRNAAAFGVDAVLLDTECCDPLYRKSIRVSVGGVLKVPFVKSLTGNQILDELECRKFELYALSPSGDAPVEKLSCRASSAFVFGTEGRGLPHDIMARCHTVKISMNGNFDSLNVATASGITLHSVQQNYLSSIY